MRAPRRVVSILAFVSFAILAAACGGDGGEGEDAATSDTLADGNTRAATAETGGLTLNGPKGHERLDCPTGVTADTARDVDADLVLLELVKGHESAQRYAAVELRRQGTGGGGPPAKLDLAEASTTYPETLVTGPPGLVRASLSSKNCEVEQGVTAIRMYRKIANGEWRPIGGKLDPNKPAADSVWVSDQHNFSDGEESPESSPVGADDDVLRVISRYALGTD